jgi:hypothetical protein
MSQCPLSRKLPQTIRMLPFVVLADAALLSTGCAMIAGFDDFTSDQPVGGAGSAGGSEGAGGAFVVQTGGSRATGGGSGVGGSGAGGRSGTGGRA